MLILLFVIGFCFVIYSFSKLSTYFLNKKFTNEKNTENELLMQELKNIDQMTFDVVAANILYTKMFSAVFRVISYLLGIAFVAYLLDIVCSLSINVISVSDFMAYLTGFMGISIIFCMIPTASCTWHYTYFKYGFSHQLKHKQVIFDFIENLVKRMIKMYPPVFIFSFILGRISVDHCGTAGVMIGTLIYELFLIVYLSLEEKRLGFAPIFNIITDKFKSVQARSDKNVDQE